MDIGFDPAKRAVTLKERGLDFADAGQVFTGTIVTAPEREGYSEERFIIAGYLGARMVVLAWTPRGDRRHVISMRHCHGKEERVWRRRMDRPG